jgi:hypothetical protein
MTATSSFFRKGGRPMPALLRLAPLLLAILLVGCNNSPKLVPVRGKVTLDGQPCCPGTIEFVPMEPESGAGKAVSLLGQEGAFELKTHKQGAGVVPARYKVILQRDPSEPRLDKYLYPESTDIVIEVPPEGLPDLVIPLPWKQPKKEG